MTNEIPPLPETLGVMALPGAILFPNALLPLYIFEERYREMLDRALGDGRMFAVAMTREDGEGVHSVGGAGLVRACVRNLDGTSHLILQGVSRVRFVNWVQVDPFRIARVEALESRNDHGPEVTALARRVREFCDSLVERGYELPKNFDTFLNAAEDPNALSDAVGSTLIPDPDVQQELLQELDVAERLKGLLASLRAQIGPE